MSTVIVAYKNTIKTTFDYNFDFYQAFLTSWIHINMETKRRSQLKKLLFNLKTCNSKKNL